MQVCFWKHCYIRVPATEDTCMKFADTNRSTKHRVCQLELLAHPLPEYVVLADDT